MITAVIEDNTINAPLRAELFPETLFFQHFAGIFLDQPDGSWSQKLRALNSEYLPTDALKQTIS